MVERNSFPSPQKNRVWLENRYIQVALFGLKTIISKWHILFSSLSLVTQGQGDGIWVPSLKCIFSYRDALQVSGQA